MRLAVYPGSFDPMTNGHVDVIRRASAVFDRLVVAVLANPRKTPLLPVDTRIGIIRAALEIERVDPDRFEVASFDGLTVDFCRARGATAIVRGLRAISDFDSEMQLAHNNRVLAPDVDSVFFMTSVENGFVSSSLVKEIASFGGDVSSMVPAAAIEAMRDAFQGKYRPGQSRAALAPTGGLGDHGSGVNSRRAVRGGRLALCEPTNMREEAYVTAPWRRTWSWSPHLGDPSAPRFATFHSPAGGFGQSSAWVIKGKRRALVGGQVSVGMLNGHRIGPKGAQSGPALPPSLRGLISGYHLEPEGAPPRLGTAVRVP
jgi:pantetheine-phosphate adenylyltransferase